MSFNRELGGWIASCLADTGARRACVLDSGAARVSLRLKATGLAVKAVDTLACHHFFSGALIPDGPAEITEPQASEWLRLRKEPDVAGRFFDWANSLFSAEEAVWLGIWRANILESGLPFRLQALGSVVVMRIMAYWHAWNRDQIGHKPMPPAAVFRHYVAQTNRDITQSGLTHEAVFQPEKHDLETRGVDLLYCYVPSGEGMKQLDQRLLLWERWIQGDPAATLKMESAGRLWGGFSDASGRAAAATRLLAKMVDIPVWAIAHSGDGVALTAAIAALRPHVMRFGRVVPSSWEVGQRSSIMKEGLIVATLAGSGAA